MNEIAFLNHPWVLRIYNIRRWDFSYLNHFGDLSKCDLHRLFRNQLLYFFLAISIILGNDTGDHQIGLVICWVSHPIAHFHLSFGVGHYNKRWLLAVFHIVPNYSATINFHCLLRIFSLFFPIFLRLVRSCIAFLISCIKHTSLLIYEAKKHIRKIFYVIEALYES